MILTTVSRNESSIFLTARRYLRFAIFPIFPILMFGCQKKTAAIAKAEPPLIPISHAIERSVSDFVDYTGRTDAKESVSVRARVTGYLTKMPFKEGAEIKAGDLLFEIDPRPYQVLVDEAQASVVLNQAQLKLAKITYERDKSLGPAVSQQQLDQDLAAVEEAAARIKSAEASVKTAQLNLDFTQVTSPISGRISRYYYTLGNLVSSNQTLLTTIMSMDPVYCYFDMDERTYHKLIQAVNKGDVKTTASPPITSSPESPKSPPSPGSDSAVQKLPPPREIQLDIADLDIPVSMALEGEDGFPHKGKINFINNQVNPSTGTVAVRGIFQNSHPKGGIWLFSPGMFVRIRLPLGEPKKSLLVIDRAIGSDQGYKFVYVIDKDNKAQSRRVKTGAVQEDGLRVIEEGLKPDDWVAVGGLLQLRPNTEVKTTQVPMPTLDSSGTPSPANKPQPPSPGGNKDKTGPAKNKAVDE